jgi:hypothetical protein
MPQNMCLGSNGLYLVHSLRKIPKSTLVQPVSYRSSCSNGIVQNAPKHESGVQWGVSGAFVMKKSDSTSLHELVH